MENAAMKHQNISVEYEEIGRFGDFVDENLVGPEMKQDSKSEYRQENESVPKGRNCILDLLLKIFLPKSITTTPPPNREIYY